ncbi:hypothetical protein [Corynebacterium efficiens YS-314]|uniref:Uncharacterized protein n=1 Tax=Corynebacterium efficiens (strain DSM 44549 / YS-314 / AJ 12310 / JCM 11189 / NBRC 100395) TaxID=196164 RepID=Q8FSN7_COREF|nr:hypothetical protein [Corynebacterium efficiens YS-314]
MVVPSAEINRSPKDHRRIQAKNPRGKSQKPLSLFLSTGRGQWADSRIHKKPTFENLV